MNWSSILGNPVTWGVVLTVLVGIGTAIWWACSIHTKVGSLSEFIAEIRGDIKNIFERLPPPRVATGSSPTKLTDFWKMVSKDLDARSRARRLAPEFVDEVKGKRGFEIFRFCQKYVEGLKFDDTFESLIQEVAYNHGISTDNVVEVLPIELRDELISLLNRADEASA